MAIKMEIHDDFIRIWSKSLVTVIGFVKENNLNINIEDCRVYGSNNDLYLFIKLLSKHYDVLIV